MKNYLVLIAITFSFVTTNSSAQEIGSAFRKVEEFKPVPLETEIKTSIGSFTSLSNQTFKPPGVGPFSAVVLMHTCGGVQNPHIRQHARELLEHGFVVLILDSFEPRGMKNCSNGSLSTQAGLVDAYAALDFLQKQSFVDSAKIYQVGYSWGGIVSTLLASPQSATLSHSKLRFRATVSNYSTCSYQNKYPFLLTDIDQPILMLLGEMDQELPLASCFPLLENLKAKGAPVYWQVIPGATHGWDKEGQGNKGYVYDKRTTDLATERMIKFISEN